MRSARFALLLLSGLAAGCAILPGPKPAEPLRLTKTAFADLPGWQDANADRALGAFLRSCDKIEVMAPQSPMGGAGYAGTAGDWQPSCLSARMYSAPARLFFESGFVPFVLGRGDRTDGFFTGYYEPEIAVSRRRHDAYQTPIYGVPLDLVGVDLGAFRASLKGQRIAGRVENGKLVPYADRAKIVRDGLAAPVLAWAADPVAVFFLHIQGSGRAVCDDGSVFRLGYAAQNGHVYTAIGKVLIERGAIGREAMSMQTIADWLHANPADAQAVMNADASYIFFREETLDDPALGAKGAEGVPLTPEASLAVDLTLHALGVPFFVATTLPDGSPLAIPAVAQDTGGAIRGWSRADIYFGAGAQAALHAGGMKQQGRMFVLLPRALAEKMAELTEYPGPGR